MKNNSSFPEKSYLEQSKLLSETTFQLIKRASPSNKPLSSTLNIFHDVQSLDQRYSEAPGLRPVGGVNLFKKMRQQNQIRSNDNRKISKRSNKENSQGNIGQCSSHLRLKKDTDTEENICQSSAHQKSVPHLIGTWKEQKYKQHITYRPKVQPQYCFKRHSSNRIYMKQRPTTSKPLARANGSGEWALNQCKEYNDKLAILGNISFNKPIVEICGDRYFQYILRDRFEDDLKLPSYIYQLSQKQFSASKAISNIRRYRPEIKDKSMMVVRGKKLCQNTSLDI